VDVADAAVASMSGGTSQPNLNSIVESLRHTPRDTRLDIDALNECSDYWETLRTYYLPFDSAPKSGSARLYQHEIPEASTQTCASRPPPWASVTAGVK